MASRADVIAGRAAVELMLKDANFKRGIDGAARKLKGFGRDASSLGKIIGPLKSLEGQLGKFPDLFGGISTGLSMLAINPFIALAAGTVAAIAAIQQYSSHTAELTDKQEKLSDANAKARETDRDMMTRLEQLAAKQKLSNDEMREAELLIGRLTDRYGNLGLSISDVTGRLVGMDTAQAKFNERQRQMATLDAKAEIAEIANNMSELQKEINSANSFGANMSWTGIKSGFQEAWNPAINTDAEKNIDALFEKKRVQSAKLAAAEQRLADIEFGSLDERIKAGDLEAKAAAAAEKERIEAEKKLAIEKEQLAIEKAKADWMEAQKKTRDAIASRDAWAALEREFGAQPFEEAKTRIQAGPQGSFSGAALQAMGQGQSNPVVQKLEKLTKEVHDLVEIDRAMLGEVRMGGGLTA